MFSTLTLIFLGLHVLGDYYLQSDEQAALKERAYSRVAAHTLLYGLPFAILALLSLYTPIVAGTLLLLVFAHGLIDTLKFLLSRRFPGAGSKLYSFDQLLHLGTLAASAGWLSGYASVYYPDWVYAASDYPDLVSWTVFVLLIAKPANVSFRHLFGGLTGVNTETPKTGAVIGTMERLLVGGGLAAGQYATLGLVIAAKTLARHERLRQEKLFAEVYLIGTFYSIIFATVAYLVCFLL